MPRHCVCLVYFLHPGLWKIVLEKESSHIDIDIHICMHIRIHMRMRISRKSPRVQLFLTCRPPHFSSPRHLLFCPRPAPCPTCRHPRFTRPTPSCLTPLTKPPTTLMTSRCGGLLDMRKLPLPPSLCNLWVELVLGTGGPTITSTHHVHPSCSLSRPATNSTHHVHPPRPPIASTCMGGHDGWTRWVDVVNGHDGRT